MLSGAAFNAFLKTLEEPPPQVVFVLATTDPQKVPATIVSRCQCFDFHAIPRRVIVDRLAEVTRRERAAADSLFPEVPPEVFQIIAESADGGFRDALSLLDQICAGHAGGTVTVEEVLELTRRLSHSLLRQIADLVFRKDLAGLLRCFDDLFFRGYDVASLGKDLLEYFRRSILLKLDKEANQVLELPAEQAKEMAEAVRDLPLEYLMTVTLHLERVMSGIRHSVHPRLLLELEMVRLSQGEACLGLEGVERRLRSLELGARTPQVVMRPPGAVRSPAPPGYQVAPPLGGTRPAPATVTPLPRPGLAGATGIAGGSGTSGPTAGPPGSIGPAGMTGEAAGTGSGGAPMPGQAPRAPVPLRPMIPANLELGERFRRFVSILQERSPRLAAVFLNASADSLLGGALTVTLQNEFMLGRARDPRFQADLQPFLTELFGDGTRLVPRGRSASGPGTTAGTGPGPGGESSAPKPAPAAAMQEIARIDAAERQRILSQPAVADALKVFGGEVTGIEKP